MQCSECKGEINHLINIISGAKEYRVEKNVTQGINYIGAGFNPDCIVNDYNCPECDATLFTDEVDVIKFFEEGK